MIQIRGRIAAARDTTANWNAKSGFVPLRGEIIVYSDRGTRSDGNGGTVPVPGIKIGDGSAYLIDLPFLGGEDESNALAVLAAHEADTGIHVTPAEKAFWNNKLNCYVEDGKLVLNRL